MLTGNAARRPTGTAGVHGQGWYGSYDLLRCHCILQQAPNIISTGQVDGALAFLVLKERIGTMS